MNIDLRTWSCHLFIVAMVFIAVWRWNPSTLTAALGWGLLFPSLVLMYFAEKPLTVKLRRALFALGALMNGLVIVFNGGHMPVKINIGLDAANPVYGVWQLATEQTHFVFLGDVFRLGSLLMYSIGDVFLVAAILWAGIEALTHLVWRKTYVPAS